MAEKHRKPSPYGNIEGIATLTHNRLALDNARGTIGRTVAAREKKNKLSRFTK